MKNKFIRFISLLLIVVLILSINLPVASARTMPFTDVPQGAWFHDAVAWAYDSGFVAGTSSTTFSPYDNITRGQFVVFLHRIAGGHRVDNRIRFHDVADSSQYFFHAVNWASDNGIVSGVGDGTNFMPSRSITREEMAVILFRFAGFQSRNTSAPITALNRFPDMNNISNFAQEGMRWAAHTGMLRGDSNSRRMNPRNFTTRAEVIVVIRRYLLNEPFTPPPAAAFTHHTVFNGTPIGGPARAHANDQQVWNFLRSQGLNSFAIAGLMGNIFAESGMRPNRVQESFRDEIIAANWSLSPPTTFPELDFWYTTAVIDGTYRTLRPQTHHWVQIPHVTPIDARNSFIFDRVGYGLIQWTYPVRKMRMHDFAMANGGDIGCLDMQLLFLVHELSTYYPTWRDLQNVTCVLQASNIVLANLRPHGWDGAPMQGRRAGYSLTYFNRFG